MTLIILILLATLYAIVYVVIIYPDKIINFLQRGKSIQIDEKHTDLPFPTVIKTYSSTNLTQSNTIETEGKNMQNVDTTFVSATTTEQKIPIQIPNEELDEVFGEVEQEYDDEVDDEVTEEDAIDCSTGEGGMIHETNGNCLFTDLVEAHHIAHGKKVSREKEEKAAETIIRMEHTNIMDSLHSQSSKYMEFAKKVIEERMTIQDPIEQKFDIEQFYVKID